MFRNNDMVIDLLNPASLPNKNIEGWRFSDFNPLIPEVFNKVEKKRISQNDGHISVNHVGASSYEKAYHYDHSIEIEEGKSKILVEEVSGNNHYVSQFHSDIKLNENAKLTHFIFVNESEQGISYRKTNVKLAKDSIYRQFIFSTGGRLQRVETFVAQEGEGAAAEIGLIYLLNGKKHFEFASHLCHLAKLGKSNELVRGIAKDTSLASFQGKITVGVGADETLSDMNHGAIIMNDGARVRSKPELEIYADNVKCSHGNTIGAFDQEAIFYCQSRGMDEATAKSLLTEGFCFPIVDLIDDEDGKNMAHDWLITHLKELNHV